MTQVIAYRDGIDPVKGGIKFQVKFSGHGLERHVAQAVEKFRKKYGYHDFAWIRGKTIISPEGRVLVRIHMSNIYSECNVALTFTPPKM